MARTLSFFTIFWLVLLVTLPLILPVYLFHLLHLKDTRKKYIRHLTAFWGGFTLFSAGLKVRRAGIENIPLKHSDFVIISNHQGNFDIPVFIAILPFSPGFMAKEELTRIPFINAWMKSLDCLPVNRENPRGARERIITRLRQEGKNPLVLFPEGTRSRGKQIGNFRTGSLKIIFQEKLDILPVSIMGTYKGFEERRAIHPAEVNVTFHPLIRTSEYPVQDFLKFLEDLQDTIKKGLS